MDINNNQTLLAQLAAGHSFEYLYFWGHSNNSDIINQSCFSQWYPSPFEQNGKQFATAEHYMMYYKAMLFGDQTAAEQILTANSPSQVKAIGRQVKNFDQQLWLKHRFDIVVRANKAKFNSDPALKAFLLNTEQQILVEASPVDNIWGVGLAQDDPAIQMPQNWRGDNLLGYALMQVRQQLQQQLPQ